MKTNPVYIAGSDFDYESFNLVLQVEHIEYTLFGYGIDRWSDADFVSQNLTADDRALIAFFQQQEIGHELLVAGLMGRPDLATARCEYNFPNFTSILDFIDLNQRITRFGESGVIGFLSHLNSQPSATNLAQAIATETRQQFAFRQLEGLFPIDIWFIPGITQSMTWTLLAPLISSCPANTPKIMWNNFPALNITNNPYPPPGPSNAVAKTGYQPTAPGRNVTLSWEAPGKSVGPNNSYTTRSDAGSPKYVAWISQLGLNYTDLQVDSGGYAGSTIQPGGDLFYNGTLYSGDPAVNDTVFVLITDAKPFLTPFNLSLIEPHIVAGPAQYQSG